MSASVELERLECPQRGAELLALQNDILEAVARGKPLHDTLDLLCRGVERLAGDVRCTVLLLEGTHLRHGAAPSVPDEYVRTIDGVEIGPAAGSCGTAAYRGEAVEVTDIANDPLWTHYKHLALPHGLRACWSTPIRARAGAILGTFALYFAECRGAGAFHRDAVRASTHLAAIAIERAAMDEAERRRGAELAESNARYEQLNYTLEQRVAERTRDLEQRNVELAQTFEDLQRAQSDLLEARRLASLARMVAGIAHELNTPLGNARVLATTLLSRCEAFGELAQGSLRRSDIRAFISDVSEAAELLEKAIASAVASVGSFKAVAVEQPASVRSAFSVSDTLQYIAHLFASALRALRGTLVLDAPSGLMLDSYPAALQQVLSIVVDNALVHGLAGRGDARLELGAKLVAEGVEIIVRDNGAGIAADQIDKVFDPFFTTRLAQGSSGLGLHVAYNLVHGVLGGDIRLESQLDVGTTVTIRLPLSAPLRI